jgi:F0F1-type ATP synthase assembly protein I
MRRDPTDESQTDSGEPDGPNPNSSPGAQEKRRQGLAYQGAAEAVAAIPIATGIGYWLDGRFDTSPYLLIFGAALGFAAFVTRLIRLGRQLEAFGDADE